MNHAVGCGLLLGGCLMGAACGAADEGDPSSGRGAASGGTGGAAGSAAGVTELGGTTSGGATSGGATSGGATSGGATTGGATTGGATSGGTTPGGGTGGVSLGGADAGGTEPNPVAAGAAGELSTEAGAAGTTSAEAGAPSAGGGGGDASIHAGGAAGSAGCRPFVMPEDCSIPDGAVLPGDLRCTGLYGDWESRELACGVQHYQPAHTLWTDNAGKERYVWLPPGQSIDASDPDDFVYPVGTRFWKEFYVGPPGSQRIGETRLLRKDELGWVYTAYVWSEDGSAAVQQNEGVVDLFGTGHDVPSRTQCRSCHSGRRGFVLGWDFVMLGPGATGVTSAQLLEAGLLDGVPADFDPSSATIPGDDVERAALGYLHANCGVSCHNESTNAEGRPSGLFLRLDFEERMSVHTTDAVTSGVNRPPSPNAELTDLPTPEGGYYDLRPLDPERSLAIARMDFRGSTVAMPPLGTHHVDTDGLDAVTAWVNQMTEERGYPAAAP